MIILVINFFMISEVVNFNSFQDSIDIKSDGDLSKSSDIKFKANCLKRLVSKRKKRLQTEHFDLDLSYI